MLHDLSTPSHSWSHSICSPALSSSPLSTRSTSLMSNELDVNIFLNITWPRFMLCAVLNVLYFCIVIIFVQPYNVSVITIGN